MNDEKGNSCNSPEQKKKRLTKDIFPLLLNILIRVNMIKCVIRDSAMGNN